MSGSLLSRQSANNASCLRSRRFPVQIRRSATSAPRASHTQARGFDQAVQSDAKEGTFGSQRLALAAAVAPLLTPLQAHCQEQAALEQAGGVSPEVLK